MVLLYNFYLFNEKSIILSLQPLQEDLFLINEFGKVAGYKINAQKPLAFLYTNDEKSERVIRETLPFTIVAKRLKYLEINVLKGDKRPVCRKL